MGGAISRLYASQYPEDVSGLVLIDYAAYDGRKALTDEQWDLLKILIGSPSEEALALYPDLEWFDEQLNLEQTLAASPLQPMPLIVLSADEPFDFTPFVETHVPRRPKKPRSSASCTSGLLWMPGPIL